MTINTDDIGPVPPTAAAVLDPWGRFDLSEFAHYNAGVRRAREANRADRLVEAGICEHCEQRRVTTDTHRRCWTCLRGAVA